MKTIVRILIVEDSEDDALLMLHHIKKGNYDIQYERIETAEKMAALLRDTSWDIVLSDYSMPHFSGLDALSLLKESGLDIPFIVISGTIGEDVAVEAMRAGAQDYIMKDNLQRLLPAVERELREAKSRSEKKRLEAEHRRAEQEREKLLTILAAKNEELESILYAGSHDLKSPLLNIQGFSGELNKDCRRMLELIKKYEPSINDKQLDALIQNDIPESLQFIRTSVSQMYALLDGLLKVSRISTANSHPEILDIDQLMKDIHATLIFQIRDKQATVTIDKLPRCYGDKVQIGQVFTNLLSNALKYLSPERNGTISVTGRIENEMSVYCVQDNGIGIDPQYHQKVFELFHRLNLSDGLSGEGIGLTIAKRIVQSHNGKIWIESEEGRGCRFFVALPSQPPSSV